MIALGVIAGVWLLGKQLEQHRLGTTDDAGSIAVWAVIAGLIGARLYHVITDWSRFSDDLGAIPQVWKGGLGIPGGLIAGILVGAWQAKRRGFRPGVILTFGAPGDRARAVDRALGQLVQPGAVRQADRPAVGARDRRASTCRRASRRAPRSIRRSSTSRCGTWRCASCCCGSSVSSASPRAGCSPCTPIGYGAGRFWIEGLRIDPAREVGGMRWNQWMALAAIAVGVVYLVVTRGRKWDVAAGATGSPTAGSRRADVDDESASTSWLTTSVDADDRRRDPADADRT